MRPFLLFVVVLTFIRCSYRWPVKTMADVDSTMAIKNITAFGVISSPVIHTTIDSLVNLPRPKTGEGRSLQETKIYSIEGKIFFWTIEPDKDIHIAVTSGKSRMICEIPNPSKAKNSIMLEQIETARKNFFKYKRSWYRMQPGIYQITGVLFYDKQHIAIGANKNHVELHPVIGFKKL